MAERQHRLMGAVDIFPAPEPQVGNWQEIIGWLVLIQPGGQLFDCAKLKDIIALLNRLKT